MNKETLRERFHRLTTFDSIDDSYELFGIYAECLFLFIEKQHKTPSSPQRDANILLQMMFSKVLHLKSMVDGISYKGKNENVLPNVIDPTVLAQLVRNIYETTCMFNLVYRTPKSKEEKEILYLLWVCSGLNYRQRFGTSISSEENKEKLSNENIEIDKQVSKINENKFYLSLEEKQKQKIKQKIKEKNYLIKFENKEVHLLYWHELIKIAGGRDVFYENIYTYLSLYSHPSYVSVIQFRDMFKKEEQSYVKLSIFNLKIAFHLISIFIADYIYLFPEALDAFNSIDSIDQIVINFNNILARNDDYSINGCSKYI